MDLIEQYTVNVNRGPLYQAGSALPVVPPTAERVEDWWYFGPEHGQHIAFYTPTSLRLLADRFGLHLASNGTGMHMFSQQPMSPRAFTLFAGGGLKAEVARRLLRRRAKVGSLLHRDFQAVSGHTLS